MPEITSDMLQAEYRRLGVIEDQVREYVTLEVPEGYVSAEHVCKLRPGEPANTVLTMVHTLGRTGKVKVFKRNTRQMWYCLADIDKVWPVVPEAPEGYARMVGITQHYNTVSPKTIVSRVNGLVRKGFIKTLPRPRWGMYYETKNLDKLFARMDRKEI